MTENKTLKCPFCGTELCFIFGDYNCPNNDCCETMGFRGNDKMWKALISGKQAQEALAHYENIYHIADDALSEIANELCDMNCNKIADKALNKIDEIKEIYINPITNKELQ